MLQNYNEILQNKYEQHQQQNPNSTQNEILISKNPYNITRLIPIPDDKKDKKYTEDEPIKYDKEQDKYCYCLDFNTYIYITRQQFLNRKKFYVLKDNKLLFKKHKDSVTGENLLAGRIKQGDNKYKNYEEYISQNEDEYINEFNETNKEIKIYKSPQDYFKRKCMLFNSYNDVVKENYKECENITTYYKKKFFCDITRLIPIPDDKKDKKYTEDEPIKYDKELNKYCYCLDFNNYIYLTEDEYKNRNKLFEIKDNKLLFKKDGNFLIGRNKNDKEKAIYKNYEDYISQNEYEESIIGEFNEKNKEIKVYSTTGNYFEKRCTIYYNFDDILEKDYKDCEDIEKYYEEKSFHNIKNLTNIPIDKKTKDSILNEPIKYNKYLNKYCYCLDFNTYIYLTEDEYKNRNKLFEIRDNRLLFKKDSDFLTDKNKNENFIEEINNKNNKQDKKIKVYLTTKDYIKGRFLIYNSFDDLIDNNYKEYDDINEYNKHNEEKFLYNIKNLKNIPENKKTSDYSNLEPIKYNKKLNKYCYCLDFNTYIYLTEDEYKNRNKLFEIGDNKILFQIEKDYLIGRSEQGKTEYKSYEQYNFLNADEELVGEFNEKNKEIKVYLTTEDYFNEKCIMYDSLDDLMENDYKECENISIYYKEKFVYDIIKLQDIPDEKKAPDFSIYDPVKYNKDIEKYCYQLGYNTYIYLTNEEYLNRNILFDTTSTVKLLFKINGHSVIGRSEEGETEYENPQEYLLSHGYDEEIGEFNNENTETKVYLSTEDYFKGNCILIYNIATVNKRLTKEDYEKCKNITEYFREKYFINTKYSYEKENLRFQKIIKLYEMNKLHNSKEKYEEYFNKCYNPFKYDLIENNMTPSEKVNYFKNIFTPLTKNILEFIQSLQFRKKYCEIQNEKILNNINRVALMFSDISLQNGEYLEYTEEELITLKKCFEKLFEITSDELNEKNYKNFYKIYNEILTKLNLKNIKPSYGVLTISKIYDEQGFEDVYLPNKESKNYSIKYDEKNKEYIYIMPYRNIIHVTEEEHKNKKFDINKELDFMHKDFESTYKDYYKNEIKEYQSIKNYSIGKCILYNGILHFQKNNFHEIDDIHKEYKKSRINPNKKMYEDTLSNIETKTKIFEKNTNQIIETYDKMTKIEDKKEKERELNKIIDYITVGLKHLSENEEYIITLHSYNIKNKNVQESFEKFQKFIENIKIKYMHILNKIIPHNKSIDYNYDCNGKFSKKIYEITNGDIYNLELYKDFCELYNSNIKPEEKYELQKKFFKNKLKKYDKKLLHLNLPEEIKSPDTMISVLHNCFINPISYLIDAPANMNNNINYHNNQIEQLLNPINIYIEYFKNIPKFHLEEFLKYVEENKEEEEFDNLIIKTDFKNIEIDYLPCKMLSLLNIILKTIFNKNLTETNLLKYNSEDLYNLKADFKQLKKYFNESAYEESYKETYAIIRSINRYKRVLRYINSYEQKINNLENAIYTMEYNFLNKNKNYSDKIKYLECEVAPIIYKLHNISSYFRNELDKLKKLYEKDDANFKKNFRGNYDIFIENYNIKKNFDKRIQNLKISINKIKTSLLKEINKIANKIYNDINSKDKNIDLCRLKKFLTLLIDLTEGTILECENIKKLHNFLFGEKENKIFLSKLEFEKKIEIMRKNHNYITKNSIPYDYYKNEDIKKMLKKIFKDIRKIKRYIKSFCDKEFFNSTTNETIIKQIIYLNNKLNSQINGDISEFFYVMKQIFKKYLNEHSFPEMTNIDIELINNLVLDLENQFNNKFDNVIENLKWTIVDLDSNLTDDIGNSKNQLLQQEKEKHKKELKAIIAKLEKYKNYEEYVKKSQYYDLLRYNHYFEIDRNNNNNINL